MRHRARALARRRQPQPWLPWVLLLILSLALLGAAEAAPGDQPQGNAVAGTELQKQPPAAGVTKVAPGVLKPRANPDPGMALATPNPSKFPMPVLKPNAATGQGATVVPK